MKEVDIKSIELHDALITGIQFDSINSNFDYIKFFLESDIFIENFGKKSLSIIIKDCYKLIINFNMWITGFDVIQQFSIADDSTLIRDEKKRFKNGFGPNMLKHLKLDLNSGSSIEMLITQAILIE